MKNVKLFSFLILLGTTFTGCIGGPLYDDLNSVEDSLGYEKLLGTYVFKPNSAQAERLGIDSNELITLKITKDSLVNFNSESYQGKYYINKMVMILDPYPKKTDYSFTWSYRYVKESGFNYLKINQNFSSSSDLSYLIEKADGSDTLHITSYASDPKYEIMRLVDFKKIK